MKGVPAPVQLHRFYAFQTERGGEVMLQWYHYDEIQTKEHSALMLADMIALAARMEKCDPADLLRLIEQEIAEPTSNVRGEHKVPS